MTTRTDKIVSLYVEKMQSTYDWARKGDATSERGLSMGADAARKACAGKLKLEGDCWNSAIREAGFTGPYTAKALAEFCNQG
jgi:hypothetical protein